MLINFLNIQISVLNMVSNKCPYNNIALPQNALVCKSLQ